MLDLFVRDLDTDFVRRNTHSNTDSNSQTNSGPVTTATIPYIRGTSETIARILQPYNIRVAHKPITTLRRLLTNVKDKDKPEDRQGAVYKIKCRINRILVVVPTAQARTNKSNKKIETKIFMQLTRSSSNVLCDWLVCLIGLRGL